MSNMREKELKLVITFHTTADAMEMEKICREQQLGGRLIPVPRQISAGCGLSWCTDIEERPVMERVIAEAAIELDDIYELMV